MKTTTASPVILPPVEPTAGTLEPAPDALPLAGNVALAAFLQWLERLTAASAGATEAVAVAVADSVRRRFIKQRHDTGYTLWNMDVIRGVIYGVEDGVPVVKLLLVGGDHKLRGAEAQAFMEQVSPFVHDQLPQPEREVTA